MVLLIEKKAVNSIPNTLQEFKILYPNVYDKAKEFTCENIVRVHPLYSLYVGQGEYAVIPVSDNTLNVVGSDEATTCHIVIFKTKLRSVSIAHLDGSEQDYKILEKIGLDLANIDGDIKELNAYVIGGYQSNAINEKNNSELLSLNILKHFVVMSYSINLTLWCTCESNTRIINDKPFPIFNGLAMRRTTLEVFPAVFSVRVPNYLLRSASHWVNSSKCIENIYDYNNKTLSIKPFDDWDKNTFRFYSTLPDHGLLNYFSTSPRVEPPSFCSRLRESFKLLGRSGKLFPDDRPKIYTIDDNGEWVDFH